jgi:hypothetical protein
MKKLEEMSIEELKVAAYDSLAMANQFNKQLQMIEAEIMKRSQTQVKPENLLVIEKPAKKKK